MNFHEGLTRHREALQQEAVTRREQDSALQLQAQDNATATLRNALNITLEAEERRKEFSRTQRQIDTQAGYTDYLKAQVDGLISAVVREAVNFHEALERWRIALEREAQSRRDNDAVVQAQSDLNAEATLTNALNLQREAERRREEITGTNRRLDAQEEHSQLQDTETGRLVEAVLKNALNLHEALDRRREALSEEARTSSDRDNSLQEQINTLITAIIQNAINLHDALDSGTLRTQEYSARYTCSH